MQLAQLATQLYNISTNFASKNVVPVVGEVFSAASSAIRQIASMDPSLSKITTGVMLVGMGTVGMARSHVIDKLKTVITGKKSSESSEPHYRLAALSSGAMTLGVIQIYIGAMGYYQRTLPLAPTMPTAPTINPMIAGSPSENGPASKINDGFLARHLVEENSTCQISNSTLVNNKENNVTMAPQSHEQYDMLILKSIDFAVEQLDREPLAVRLQESMRKNNDRLHIHDRVIHDDICQELTDYTKVEKPDVLMLFAHGKPTEMQIKDGKRLQINDLYEDSKLIDCIKRNLKPDSQIFLQSCSTGKPNFNWIGEKLVIEKNFAQVLADTTGHEVQAPTYDLFASECKIDWDDVNDRPKYSCITGDYYDNDVSGIHRSRRQMMVYPGTEIIKTFFPNKNHEYSPSGN